MRDNIGLYRGKPKNKGDYYFFSLNWKEHCKDGFVYGSLVIAHGRYYICVSALCRVNCSVNNGVASMIEVIPETVGQYTGLNDSTKWEQLTKEEQSDWLKNHTVEEWNGKKIFEGDIVRDVFMELNAKVVFYDSSFWLVYQTREGGESTPECEWADILDELQVVGNIHDNPELLKGGAE